MHRIDWSVSLLLLSSLCQEEERTVEVGSWVEGEGYRFVCGLTAGCKGLDKLDEHLQCGENLGCPLPG